MRKAASALDYREIARRRLPHFLFEYIDSGSYDQVTLRRNVEDLANIALRQRVLRDVSNIDLSTSLFGEDLAMPVALGPVGLSGMYARRGEVQAVRAANKAGLQLALSTMSLCSLTEVSAAAQKPIWFQLYMVKDRGFIRDMMQTAAALGCPTLFLTVDLPQPGSRYRDVRSGLTGARGPMGQLRRFTQCAMRPAWAWDVGIRGRPHQLGNVAPVLGSDSGMLDFLGWIAGNFDPSITWKDLDWIRAEWPGKFVLKGILDPEDARDSAKAGVDGIVVSNHGGRQLDGVPSSAAALPAIADAVGGDLTILADGGVRSGLDVVRMLALGAQGVLLGRAWAYALAARGEAGVAHMLQLMQAEMRIAMALTGCKNVSEISRDILVTP
ncbi:FMN-dependent L-lactate dehydrogenase LldD [Sphingomonas sp. G-3-2-10]|uniref:FMN-dependent L-lactate dehydrogenase LldD n=1 Tax=Sphingomonas sp. G-3-2-10 TaxID=2728838 RepID=UPI001469E719|nr:FMN-dependent L-lactate dehydrogenase LldD [Sphingomonas sp. G-3-2-10]NML06678.1 FMN-dependent L-lactate dehydrogenase LldD [Sphingomonas sp. G-3-2-10]